MSVVIVGAGAAGLAAAQLLCKHEFNVVILEARNRAGGRINPVSVPVNLIPTTDPDFETLSSQEVIADSGASWVHGLTLENPFYDKACSHKIGLFSTSSDDQPSSSDTLLTIAGMDQDHPSTVSKEEFDSTREVWDRVCVGLNALAEDEAFLRRPEAARWTLAMAIDLVVGQLDLTQRTKQILGWFLSRVGISMAAELSSCSFLTWADSADDGEHGEALVAGGLGRSFLPLLLAGIEDKIIYNCRAHQISTNVSAASSTAGPELLREGAAVQVHTNQGLFCADFVISTCSPEVLRRGGLQFRPDLPPLVRASIGRMRMGVMNVVLLRFRRRFWSNDFSFFGIIPARHAPQPQLFSTFLNLTRARGDESAPLLMVQVYGEAAIVIESLTVGEIAERATEALRHMFIIPEHGRGQCSAMRCDDAEGTPQFAPPIGCAVHCWGSDDLAWGSWTLPGPGCSLADFDSLASPMCGHFNGIETGRQNCRAGPSCLQLAGESTHRDSYGTIHGAFLSGVRAAQHLIYNHSGSKDQRALGPDRRATVSSRL